MNVKVMKISPEIAKEMLTHNTANRKMSDKRVSYMYAEDMRRGEWQENGESICFNKDGVLLNGQHRLQAILESGCTFECVVVTDINSDVTLYDRGRNRSVADAMILGGMKASKLTCAMAKLYEYSNSDTKINVVSEGRIKEFHVKHAESIQAVIEILGKGNGTAKKGANVKVGYFATALFNAYESGVQKDVLKRFVEIVKTGFYDKRSESAAVVIRNDMMCGYLGTRSTGDAVYSMYAVENAIKDFAAGYNRKKTYKNTTTRVYGKEKKDE